jgi:uncharacterized membrane protein YphA (DoxX/SURF4 family)
MKAPHWPSEFLWMFARWLVGGLFVYLGLTKALDPVAFLKIIRQYDAVGSDFLATATAATLPGLEIFCGALLITGVAVRGTVLVLLALLAALTALVLRRALALHVAGDIPFCAVSFDCGCGSGEVNACRKLAENTALIVLCAGLAPRRCGAWCLRYSLI